MFHPRQTGFEPEAVQEEYLELFNRGDQAVNLEGWRLDRGVVFTFPEVILEAMGYVVVAANRDALLARYPATANVVAIGSHAEQQRRGNSG